MSPAPMNTAPMNTAPMDTAPMDTAPMDTAPMVAVVIVNFETPEATLQCVGSVQQLAYPQVEIIVVDNGSSDDSVARLIAHRPLVTVLDAGHNSGFAAGANQGIRHALAAGRELVWLLNSDATVRANALDLLVEQVFAHPELDVFSSWIGGSGSEELWFAAGQYRRWRGAFHHVDPPPPRSGSGRLAPYRVDWVSGCSMLVRGTALHRVGLLDEGFFLYGEDLDWQLRARRTPQALVLPDRLVEHRGGHTVARFGPGVGRRFLVRSYLRLARRHAGPWLPLWWLHWAWEFFLKPLARRDLTSVRAALGGSRPGRL